MAKKTSFNIQDLTKQVFGITGVRFAIPTLKAIANTAAKTTEFAAGQLLNEALYEKQVTANQNKQYTGIDIVPAPTAASVQSVLGTPIYEQITLTVPATVVNGAVTSKALSYSFPDWPLSDITPQWLIKKENTQGGIGTVKEFIQQDDFQMVIRGFLINYASQDYPQQLLSDLWAVINAGKSLGITSLVPNLLGIHNIVITDAKFPPVEGYMNIQPFELNCLSDYPTILQIKSVKTQRPITAGL
jgi:hypothetical protein